MAAPVSFGDVVAMANIAWKIAQAFTKGRRSAPAEFREIENQLYSLSAALAAFKKVGGDDIAVDPADLPTRFHEGKRDVAQTLSGILGNCRETLEHLERIVNKYGIVADPKDPTKSRLRRWSRELLKNYRKIEWTTEAGNLSALRSELLVHTNSLDLVLGIIVSSRTSRIEDSLSENSAMLKEIHSWWIQNLKDATSVPNEPALERARTQSGLQEFNKPMSFEVSLTVNGAPQLLCSEASLDDDWAEPGSHQLFVCRCTETGAPLHSRVENIALSPLCFAFRRSGNAASWILFKALDKSTNEMVTILIKSVAAGDVHEFEESFIQRLTHIQANAMLQRGMSNSLVHLSPNGQHVRALHLQSDMVDLHKSIDAVTFRVGHRELPKSDVEGLGLLNFQELGHQGVRRTDPGLDYAELAIYYGSQAADKPADITKTVVHLHHSTSLRLNESDVRVVVQGVECLGFIQDQQIHRLETADVIFNVATLEAAKTLHQRLEDMRMELYITSLQYPRLDEIVVLHLQATEVQCDVAVISDAELLITRSSDEKYRLIVTSRNRCTVLTQTLPDAFFTSSRTQSPTFVSPTWLVQLDGTGNGKRKVHHYPNGFRFLSFRNANAEKMFELGRNALLHGAQGKTPALLERPQEQVSE